MERRKVGSFDVIALTDTIQSYPTTSVYPGAGDVLKSFTAYVDGDGAVALNFASFLVVGGGATVLVDTGWGPEYDGQLPAELRAAGVDPGSIDIVTFTHLHGDHTGWNFARDTGARFFPNARYLVPRLDWEHLRWPAAALQLLRARYASPRSQRPPRAYRRRTRAHSRGDRDRHAWPYPRPYELSPSVPMESGASCSVTSSSTRIDAERPELDCSFDWDHSIARATVRPPSLASRPTSRSLAPVTFRFRDLAGSASKTEEVHGSPPEPVRGSLCPLITRYETIPAREVGEHGQRSARGCQSP